MKYVESWRYLTEKKYVLTKSHLQNFLKPGQKYMYVNEFFKILVNWSVVLHYMQCTEFTEFSRMNNWTLGNHFQTQVLHFNCVSLSKHIHCIHAFFSFSHKGRSPAIPELPLRRLCWSVFYFPTFIIWTVFFLTWLYSDNCRTRVSHAWHQLQHDPVAGSRETFAKVLLSSCKSRDNCKGFSGILQLSLSKISYLWELPKYPLRNSFQGIN